MRIRGAANRDLLDHLNAVAFEADDFLRIVGEETKFADAEIEQDLRAEPVIAQVAAEAELRVRLDGIETFLLQLVSVNLRGQADAAAFLAHVNEDAIAFVGNL